MIFDSILQKIIIMSVKKTGKDLFELTTTDIKPVFIKYINKYVNEDIKINDKTEILVANILIRAASTSKGIAITILDFMRAWNILCDNAAFDHDLVSHNRKADANIVEFNGLPGRVLNREVDSFDPVFGRDSVIDEMVTVLMRRKKGSVLLTGAPGTGKTSIVQELTYRIERGLIPMLKNYIVFQLDSILLKTLASSPMGMSKIFEIINASTKKVILFIDEFHNICTDERISSPTPSVAELLKPAMASGDIQVIGATTEKEAKKYVEHDKALTRRIQCINIKELEPCIVKEIIHNLIPVYEEFHQSVIINPIEVVDFMVEASARYIPEKWEPDRSIDILDEGLSLASCQRNIKRMDIDKNVEVKVLRLVASGNKAGAMEILNKIKQDEDMSNKNQRALIKATLLDFKKALANKASIPIELLSLRDLDRLRLMEDNLRDTIVGQNRAVARFVSAIKKFKTGLSNPDRPTSIMMVGPTGTGKTEICKRAAQILFDGRRDSFIRLDMTEFSSPHSSSTLIGSPPGYVNSDQGGKLTEAVSKNPYSLVLFDELEKAHDLVINLLLQILDDGVLTDAMGKKVNFKNCIIVLTSNAGMLELIEEQNTKHLGFHASAGSEQLIPEKKIKDFLKKYFRPEFINRIDSICVFDYFTDKEVRLIIDKEIGYALSRSNISVTVSDNIKDSIIADYYAKEFGARSLKRGVEELIIDALADFIVNNPDAQSFAV